MPPRKKQFPPTETPVIAAVKKLLAAQTEQVEKRMADVLGYSTGALEQLMFQQGQAMTVQAGIVEYLEELSTKRRDDVGAELRIKSIVEQNIAKAKAEREAREKALAEERATKAAEPADEGSNRADNQRNAIPDGVCPSCGSLSPEKCNQPCTDLPASAYRSVDDPALAAPDDIAPEPPADAAPALTPGDA